MSTTVSYKGQTLATVSNQTKTLLTEGKYLEDDLTLVDVSGGGAVLTTKNISANGTYNASSDSADGYSQVTVAVPASAVDSGTKNITANGTHDVVGYASASVSVPNSYSAGDEGKVVSNGALVAQTAHADVTPTTSDQTIDTTLNNSLKVKGDADLVASNIKKDVEIFGVTGSYEGGGETDVSVPLLKDVVFVDYDGTIVQNYTKQEFLALNAMPSNPSHSGLIAQGWNWTLADAKGYVEANGILCVGQNYRTDDGKTRLYISVQENLVDVPAYVQITTTVRGGVTIDWGDGATTVTTANANAKGKYSHTYTASGKYIITFECTDGTYGLGQPVGGNGFTIFLANDARFSWLKTAIYAAEIGDDVTGMQDAFVDCPQLRTISIPTTLSAIKGKSFANSVIACVVVPSGVAALESGVIGGSRVKFICIPKTVESYVIIDGFDESLLMATLPSVSSIPVRVLYGCKSLQKAAVPGTYTSIASNYFRECASLRSVTIPATVANIAQYAFTGMESIKEYHFLPTTPPTLASASNMFTTNSFTKIYVPYSADHSILNAYKTATNWSTFASYIEEEPQ